MIPVIDQGFCIFDSNMLFLAEQSGPVTSAPPDGR